MIQKSAIIICFVLIAIGVAFGFFTRINYSHLSVQAAAYENAIIEFGEDEAFYIDEMSNKTKPEDAISILDEYPYAFLVECEKTEHCFECTKYIVKVDKVIKGDNDETGNNIVLYQWVWFEKSDENQLSFNSPDYSLPLIENKKYLVFAEKRDYCNEYQRTLKYNEYSIPLRGPVPTAYIINDVQNRYIISSDNTYSSISDMYYLCFSKESLKDINSLSDYVIKHYY